MRFAEMKSMELGSSCLLVAIALGLAPTASAQKVPDLYIAQDAMGPQIAASGDSVYLIWHGGGILFNRSMDGGASWLDEPIRVDRGSSAVFFPQIAAANGSVYVTWPDNRHWSPPPWPWPPQPILGSAIYFNRSLDGGLNWLTPDIRLDTKLGIYATVFPQIAASGDSVYVVWRDTRNGNSDVYFNRSLDGGSTWLPTDLKINQAGEAYDFQIAASGDSVYVTWDYSAVYFNRSLDGGSTWLSSDIRLDSTPGINDAFRPQILALGDSVYVTWIDARNPSPTGFLDIYFNRSLDRGSTWLPTDVRLDTDLAKSANSLDPQIAAAGDAVYVTWCDERDSGSAIYFNRSLDQGASWLTSDVRLDTNLPGPGKCSSPQIAAAGDSVYVTWQDRRNLGAPGDHRDIYFDRSLDRGTTWLPWDTRLEADLPGADDSESAQIVATGNSVYLTWLDWRTGVFGDVCFNIPFGAQPYGEGTAGSAGITPSLRGTDSLNIGSRFTVTVSDGLGGAFGILALGGYGSKVSPETGRPQLVNPIDLLAPILLEGTPGAAGEGSYSIDISIPADNALLGFNVT
jgi:hypothetical protein